MTQDNKTNKTALYDLLLPGTPDAICQEYLSYAAEAKTRSFGLLEEDLIILDTETTGLSFKNDSLIEIAAARLSGREIVDTFQTFVKPPKAIPAEITELTSITNADVMGAPLPEEAVSALAAFAAGSPVVAHNATFDRTFIEKVKGGTEVSETWIDSLALSRIALPRLKSHALSVLAEAFELDPVSHRAMDDVEALCGLWRILLVGLAHFDAGFLSTLSHMHPEVSWPYRFIFSHLHAEVSGTQDTNAKTAFSLQDARAKILRSAPLEPKEDARDKEESLRSLDLDTLKAAFTPDGLIGAMYEQFEARPAQLKMVESVARALNDQENLAVEAGTGVGKSIAYLLPLALYAKENNITCGVATKSIALTDQLMGKEFPALAQVFASEAAGTPQEPLRFASLKGYEHYPCLRKVERALHAPLPLEFVENGVEIAAVDQLNALAVILANACQAPEGDLDSLGIRWRNVPQALVSANAEECQKKACPYFLEGCPLHGARRRAAAADVVVTNHALLLRDIAADGGILPPVAHWVIDEAHSFADEARHQWAREVSAQRMATTLERLGGLRAGLIHGLLVHLKDIEAATPIQGLLTKAASEVARVGVSMEAFFDAVYDALSEGKRGTYKDIQIWIGQEYRSTGEWQAIADTGKAYLDCLEALDKTLQEAQALLQQALPAPDALRAAFMEAVRMLVEQQQSLALILDGTNASYVYSFCGRLGRGGRGAEKLLAQPLEVGTAFAEQLYPSTLSVIYCSATMAVGEDFSHFDEEVGLSILPREMTRNVQIFSAFNFDEQMAVICANDVPAYTSPAYHEHLARLLLDVHVAMDGSVLTLFTNRRDMEAIYDLVAPQLAERGLELQQQSRKERPWRLQSRFIANKKMSLFALKSFWEGIDARGGTLRCVVIPKLPFASPHDPLMREREARDRMAWFKHALPEAVLEVKQAAGRLIRSADDAGILLLCDERILTKSYGTLFRTSLPSKTQSDLGSDVIGSYISTWRETHEG